LQLFVDQVDDALLFDFEFTHGFSSAVVPEASVVLALEYL
jgi:hypothetical protein